MGALQRHSIREKRMSSKNNTMFLSNPRISIRRPTHLINLQFMSNYDYLSSFTKVKSIHNKYVNKMSLDEKSIYMVDMYNMEDGFNVDIIDNTIF